MTPERYRELMKGGILISAEESREGWHFCREWDFLLIGPEMKEREACSCFVAPQCTTCEE